MPIVNADASRWSNANMTSAQAFETKLVDTVGTGREVMRGAGTNGSSPANAYEGRIQQETGSH